MLTFSIVIPTYNRAHLIGRTIDSVLSQTYSHWELLIVDDGSSDNTEETVKPYLSDNRIKYIYQQNAKESAARNHGMRLAQGDFLCLLDSDDIYHANHLQVLFDRIEKENRADGFYHTFSWIQKNDAAPFQRKIVQTTAENGPLAVLNNQVLVNNVCFSKSIYTSMKFRENLYINEDMEFFLRVAVAYPVFIITEYTTTVFMHGGNTENRYNRASSYYKNRIDCLEDLSSNKELMHFLPQGFFFPQLASYFRWQAQALKRETKLKDARKSVFQAFKLNKSELLQKENWIILLQSLSA